ncbi:MAG: competence/damage-inducible protein A [Phycisphaerae bacterium]|jgi:nicotinamide-nucleotide amidase
MADATGDQFTERFTLAEVLSIGTELALGQSLDTNAAWIAQRLAACGIRCRRHLTVPDEIELIRDALVTAGRAADVIVATGGLGPTADDLTRQALAEATGSTLIEDATALAQIREFFRRRGREMPERNRVQALRPECARIIENPCGTAPGVQLQLGRAQCFALPGVPSEMRAMFERDVAPRLRSVAGGSVIRSRILQTIGLPESELGARIADLMTRGRNPEVGTTAELGVIGVRINATADSPAAADSLLDEAEREIRGRLGDAVFGQDDDTLAAAVGRLLVKRGATVCTAESCTGGMIGAALTDVAGSSRYFRGAVVAYADELKTAALGVSPESLRRFGAVSEPVARAMAENARSRLHATYALAVTGIAGPTGGDAEKPVGLVYLALAGPRGTVVREHRFGEDSDRYAIRVRTVRAALAALRLELLHERTTG